MKKTPLVGAGLLMFIEISGVACGRGASRPLRVAPWPCGDDIVCAAACEKGDPTACTEHAYHLNHGRLLPMDQAKARRLLEKACDKDQLALACFRLANHLRDEAPRDESRTREVKKKGEQFAERDCERGDAAACDLVAGGLLGEKASAEQKERGKALQARVDAAYAEACRGGDARACVSVRTEVAQSVRPALLELCQKKNPQACSRLAAIQYTIQKDEEFFNFLAQGCELGVMDDCSLGAIMTQKNSPTRTGDAHGATFRKRAGELLMARCEANAVKACTDWLSLSIDDRWRPDREAFAAVAFRERKLLSEACEQGDEWSCLTLSGRLSGGFGDQPVDAEKAIFYQKKGCPSGSELIDCTRQISALGPVQSLSTSGGGGCVVDASSGVRCWGMAGENSYVAGIAPFGTLKASQVSLGPYHGCVLAEAGLVQCWGDIWEAVSKAESTKPKPVALTEPITQLTSGINFSCGIGRSGQVHCWGQPTYGVLGAGVRERGPVAVAGRKKATSIDAIGNMVCAALSGVAQCWGELPWKGTEEDGNLVKFPQLGSDLTQVSLGAELCAVTKAGKLVCVSNKLSEQGKARPGAAPGGMHTIKQIEGLPAVVQTSARGPLRCARTEAGEVWCWGKLKRGTLGDGKHPDWDTPVKVKGLTGAVDIHVGNGNACARLQGGELRCWGEPLLTNDDALHPYLFGLPQPVAAVTVPTTPARR